MIRKFLISIALAIATTIVPVSVSAQPVMDAFGRPASADEKRIMQRRIDALVDDKNSLRRENKLQAGTIAGIATRLGLQYPGLSEVGLFRKLEDQIDLAESLQTEIDKLRQAVLRLQNLALRDELSPRVQAAVDAFEVGDFELAERLLADLAVLRERQSEAALDAYEYAIGSQAKMAELQGREEDYARADKILAQASNLYGLRALIKQLERLDLRLREASQFGRPAKYRGALRFYEESVSPLFDAFDNRELRSRAVVTVAKARSDLGLLISGQEGLEELRQAAAFIEEEGLALFGEGFGAAPDDFKISYIEISLNSKIHDSYLSVEEIGFTDLSKKVSKEMFKKYDLTLDFKTVKFQAQYSDNAARLRRLRIENIILFSSLVERINGGLETQESIGKNVVLLAVTVESLPALLQGVEDANTPQTAANIKIDRISAFVKSVLVLSDICSPVDDLHLTLWGPCGQIFPSGGEEKLFSAAMFAATKGLETAQARGGKRDQAVMMGLVGSLLGALAQRTKGNEKAKLLRGSVNAYARTQITFMNEGSLNEQILRIISTSEALMELIKYDPIQACDFKYLFGNIEFLQNDVESSVFPSDFARVKKLRAQLPPLIANAGCE